MRKITIALTLTASICTYAQKSHAGDFQSLISGQQAPLNKQLKDLDSSWRQVAISGQYEMGDLMKSWSGLFGAVGYNNIYYTQGQTVRVSDETYVVAYRLPSSGKPLDFKAFFETAMGAFATGADCSATVSSSTPKITPETDISLSLLNVKTIGSLNDVRPFDLKADLAALEKMERESKAACEQAKLEQAKLMTASSSDESNLKNLGFALQSYANSHDGKLPNMKNADGVKVALKDFVTDESMFVNPETSEPYLPNPSLSGKKLADIANSYSVIAFYEANPAADGTVGVVMLDGFYQRMTPENWQKTKQESKLP
jgi:hypothetical protein